jgi:hypothetical protein
MGSGSVEVLSIGIEHPVELLLMQDEQMIEAFTPHASQKAFTGRIRSRGVIRDVEHLDLTRVRNTGEVHPKLTIVVTDEILWPLAKGRGFAQLLRDPAVGRRSCDADMNHFARVQINDAECKERMEQEVGDRETRHRPTSAPHECAGRLPRSAHVVESYAPVACTSGSCVYRRGYRA